MRRPTRPDPPIRLRVVPVLLAGAALLPGAPPHETMDACGAGHSAQESLFLRQQRLIREPELAQLLPGRVGPTPQAGDIALIEASSQVMAPPNEVDLSGWSISITPGPSGFTLRSEVSGTGSAIDDAGIPLGLNDDDFALVELPFSFPYYGKEYTYGFVHSDGNFTFVNPEPSSFDRNFSRAAGGPPRIAPLFRDLDPSKGGKVRFLSQGSRAVVTWDEVPQFSSFGIGKRQTFRMVLHESGRIEFDYGALDLPGAVVGTFPGVASRKALAVDWSAPEPGPIQGEPILAEIFADERVLDEYGIVHTFFRTHEDAYDSLLVFNAIGQGASRFSLAHAYPVRNDIEGIGEQIGDWGAFFGSGRRLSAFVNMGALSDYPESPLAPIPGLPTSSLLTILAHEVGHRFLAYPRWIDPETGEESRSLLGRQFAHWSFFFNSDASVLEGNAIKDHGPGVSPRFETVAATQAYSMVDQYLMGIVDASEVPATFLVEDPVGSGPRLGTAARSPEVGVKFDGIRKEVRIEDIIAAEGPRRPQASVAQRHFRHAFVLVVEDAESPDADAIRKVQQVRTNWRAFFNIQVGTRATVATELVKMLHLSTWPAAGVVAGLPGSGRVTISEARDTDLAVSLRLDDAIAAIPASVTIPAGELFAEFEIRGRRTGPATLTAVATEPGFDRAVTRLYVAESVDGLKLERLHFDNLRGLAGAKVPWPVDYRVRDENRLPYSGIELSFSQGIPGAEPIPSAMTDSDGRVRVEWQLAPQLGTQVLKAYLKDAPEMAVLTRAKAAGAVPTLAPGGAVNAASGERASSGRGFAPGSLVTVYGIGLATEEKDAHTLLAFGNRALPLVLDGIRIHVGGVSAPLVRVSPSQVTFQLPFELEGPQVEVGVATLYARGDTIAIPLSPLQPGLFPGRVAGTATDPANLIAGRGTAKAGGLIEVFGTGLGPVTPAGRTGKPGLAMPLQTVNGETRAWVDGQEVKVRSSALATLEAGVYRVVLELPEDLEPGMHEVRIAVDGVESNTITFASE